MHLGIQAALGQPALETLASHHTLPGKGSGVFAPFLNRRPYKVPRRGAADTRKLTDGENEAFAGQICISDGTARRKNLAPHLLMRQAGFKMSRPLAL